MFGSNAPKDDALSTVLRKLPLRAALLTDGEGAIVVRAVGELGDEATLELQRMCATFAQTAEQAGKAGLGKNMHMTAFYGAHAFFLRSPRIFSAQNSHPPTRFAMWPQTRRWSCT